MRTFTIHNGIACIVLDEKDVLGIIGELVSEVSQMDPGDEILISCFDGESEENGRLWRRRSE